MLTSARHIHQTKTIKKSTRIHIRTRTTTLISLSEFIFKSMYGKKALIKIVVDHFFLFRDTKIDALKGVLLVWHHMSAVICTPNAKIKKINAIKISKYLFEKNYLFRRVMAFSQNYNVYFGILHVINPQNWVSMSRMKGRKEDKKNEQKRETQKNNM